ncbi:MAG: phage tail protein [Emticicia sp.]|uniref:phage tail protein n=1 Tax=Emticicia sp. TaxID=1930953 RepID=UPI003BA795E2
MATPYIGEIRMMANNFPPAGWARCDGSLLPISEYDTLFALIGTTYGGDGQTTFAVPDLRGRLPIHQGTGPGLSTRVIGQSFGTESVTLTNSQIPQHTHTLLLAATAANASSPANTTIGNATANLYIRDVISDSMNPNSIAQSGGNQPHENRMPSLTVNFVIALFGVFPSPN